jgi:hypothetical protein
MALLRLPENVRMLGFDCIALLPDLEEDVFFEDTMIVDLEESFVAGLDDWWSGFVTDMYL